MEARTENSDDDAIRALLAARPLIALVGASSRPERPSHRVMGALLAQGYDVVPVNPNQTTVHELRVYPDLGAIPTPIGLVDVFRRPESAPEIARQAVAIGASALWLQLGVISEEAARIASDAGLRVVMDRCTIQEHSRLIGMPFPTAEDAVGLCRECVHSRLVETPRSTFWLCGRAASDPSFPKYPRLPILACRGFEPKR